LGLQKPMLALSAVGCARHRLHETIVRAVTPVLPTDPI
jgi:hypothetical protein